MKKGFFIILIISSLLGCNKDKDQDVFDSTEIHVQCFYTTKENRNKQPEIGSKIFIYYNYDESEVVEYVFESENGTLSKGNVVITPQQQGKTQQDGIVTFSHLNDKQKILIIVESFHYPEKVVRVSFLPQLGKDVRLECTFEP